jgi:predicted PurR-regulated permease PerM
VAVGSTQDIIVMGLYTVVMNIVQGSVLAPIVYGRAVSIHPAICLLAAPIGASLGGIVGMFLAVPIIGVIANTWRTVIVVFGDSEPADITAAEDERGILTAGAPAPSPSSPPA